MNQWRIRTFTRGRSHIRLMPYDSVSARNRTKKKGERKEKENRGFCLKLRTQD